METRKRTKYAFSIFVKTNKGEYDNTYYLTTKNGKAIYGVLTDYKYFTTANSMFKCLSNYDIIDIFRLQDIDKYSSMPELSIIVKDRY